MTTISARLAVYEASKNRLGTADYPASWSASFPLNDTPALNLSYPLAADGYELLAGGWREVAVEVSDGRQWTEPRNARYLLLEQAFDHANGPADVAGFTLPGIAWLLDRVGVLPGNLNPGRPYDSEGKRKFLSSNPGQIVASILNEARRAIPDSVAPIQLGFTPGKDSLGRDWTGKATIYYAPGVSLLTILLDMAAQGRVDWWMQGRTLHMTQSDATSRKLPHIRLDGGESSAAVRATNATLLNTAILLGEDGKTWREDNLPSTPKPWGSLMSTITQGGVSDPVTAKAMIAADLQAGAKERVEYTRDAAVQHLPAAPLIDFQPGDYVQARNRSHEWEEMRVHQITLNHDSGLLRAAFVLNDRFMDAQVRQQRRIKGIVNGAASNGGNGSQPSAPVKPLARPSAPGGFIVESEGMWREDGSPASSVTGRWGAVDTDINGNAIFVESYIVLVDGDIHYTTSTAATIENLAPNRVVEFKVAAYSPENGQSTWASQTVRLLPPSERLYPPTRPTVTSNIGIVSVAWDGNLVSPWGGAAPTPSRFSHVIIQERNAGQWKDIGVFTGPGELLLDRQDSVGATVEFRLIARDKGKLDSLPSEVGSTRVENQIATDVRNALDRANAAEIEARNLANTVKVDRLLANGVVIAGNPTNKVGAILLEDGAVTAPKLYVDQALIDKLAVSSLWAGKITGQMISADALNGKTITGPVIRTASSNRRMELKEERGEQGLWFYDTNNRLRAHLSMFNDNLFRIKTFRENGAQAFELNSDGYLTTWNPEGTREAYSISTSMTGRNGPDYSNMLMSTEYTQFEMISQVTDRYNRNCSIVLRCPMDDNDVTPYIDINASGTINGEIGLHAGNSHISLYKDQMEVNVDQGDSNLIVKNDAIFMGKGKYTKGEGVTWSSVDRSITMKGARLVAPLVWDVQVSGGLPVAVQKGGLVGRTASVRAIKHDIRDIGITPERLLDVPVRDWYDKNEVHDNNGSTDGLARIPGVVAEEVEEAGLKEFCVYDDDGKLLAVMYDRIMLLAIPLIKDLRNRVEQLERGRL